MGWLHFISLLLIFSLGGQAQESKEQKANPPKKSYKERLEQIFVWKMSDELGLNAAEDQKFREFLLESNKNRTRYATEANDTLERLQETASDAQRKALLDRYIGLLKIDGASAATEIHEIRKIIGDTRAVKYLRVKEKLRKRLRKLINKARTGASEGPATNLD